MKTSSRLWRTMTSYTPSQHVELKSAPEAGIWLLPLAAFCVWPAGDVIEAEVHGRLAHCRNISERRLPFSRFHRDFNSLVRQLGDPRHPLKRVVVFRKMVNVAMLIPHTEKSFSAEPMFTNQGNWRFIAESSPIQIPMHKKVRS